MDISNYCSPAIVYLVISAISIAYLAYTSFSIFTIFFKVIFTLIWAWVLNWICSKGYTTISWLLVILPYIFVGFLLLMSFEVIVATSITNGPLVTSTLGTPALVTKSA